MPTKYTLSGQAVEVHSEVKGGHLICHIYETEYGDEQSSPQFTDEKLYDKPPVLKLESKVAELDSRITELQQKRMALDQELRAAEASHTKLMDRFKCLPALQYLGDFIDGKISHFVTDLEYGYPVIADFASAIACDSDDWKRKRKLLVLYGDSNGDLQWRLHQYHDGSGMKRQVWPCASLEIATAKAREICSAQILSSLDNPREWVISGAKQYGVALPEGYEQRFLEACIKSNLESIDREQAGLDKRKGSIESMRVRLMEISSPQLATA